MKLFRVTHTLFLSLIATSCIQVQDNTGSLFSSIVRSVTQTNQNDNTDPEAVPLPPTPVEENPTLPDCNRGPSVHDIKDVTPSGLTSQFDGDGVAELKWEIRNGNNVVIASQTITPTSSTVLVSYPEQKSSGNYMLVFTPTKCNMKAGTINYRTFSITIATPVPSPSPTQTQNPNPSPSATPAPSPSIGYDMSTALQQIRILANSSTCVSCHNGVIGIAFAHASNSIMLENLATVVQTQNATQSRLYIRSQRGETHGAYTTIPANNAPAWKSAIEAYIAARGNNSGGNPGSGDSGGGSDTTTAGAKKIILLKDRISLASFIRERFTRDQYSPGNSSNGAGIALEHIYNEADAFGGVCMTYNLAEFGWNRLGFNVSGRKFSPAGGMYRNYVCGDGAYYNHLHNLQKPYHRTSISVYREISRTKVCDYLFGIRDHRHNWYKEQSGIDDGHYYRHNPDDAVRIALEPFGINPDSDPSHNRMQDAWRVFHIGHTISEAEKSALLSVGTKAKQNGFSNFEAWRFILLTSCLSPIWQVK